MANELKQWAVADENFIVGAFDAPQEYVDNYVDLVVDDDNKETPSWYKPNVTFVDVTGLNPRPVVGWYKDSSGSWIDGNPVLTADRDSIPADGITSAKITFTQKGPKAPTTVNFDVNGQVSAVPLTNGSASVDVASANPGDVVVVTAGKQSVTVNVTV